jgi:hypothetical protein
MGNLLSYMALLPGPQVERVSNAPPRPAEKQNRLNNRDAGVVPFQPNRSSDMNAIRELSATELEAVSGGAEYLVYEHRLVV